MNIFDQVQAEAEKSAEPTAKIVVVHQKPANGSQTGRVLFEGTPEDAQVFIANNFPRIHSEEAGPDYYTEEKDA